MIELDAWEIEDIRRDLRELVANNAYIADPDTDDVIVIDDIEDGEVLLLATHIVEIHSLHVARAIRASMVVGLKRIENKA